MNAVRHGLGVADGTRSIASSIQIALVDEWSTGQPQSKLARAIKEGIEEGLVAAAKVKAEHKVERLFYPPMSNQRHIEVGKIVPGDVIGWNGEKLTVTEVESQPGEVRLVFGDEHVQNLYPSLKVRFFGHWQETNAPVLIPGQGPVLGA